MSDLLSDFAVTLLLLHTHAWCLSLLAHASSARQSSKAGASKLKDCFRRPLLQTFGSTPAKRSRQSARESRRGDRRRRSPSSSAFGWMPDHQSAPNEGSPAHVSPSKEHVLTNKKHLLTQMMDQDAMDQDAIRTTLSTHDNTQTWSMTLHKCGT